MRKVDTRLQPDVDHGDRALMNNSVHCLDPYGPSEMSVNQGWEVSDLWAIHLSSGPYLV